MFATKQHLQSTLGTDEAPMVVETKGKDLADSGSDFELRLKLKSQEIPELLNIKTSIEEGAP
ncbi:MAG: hypothetical protein MZV64_70490 [Ignavibacteriales bacterium]|nr:hypothetical protein [Ignavibacteriales bacterium]